MEPLMTPQDVCSLLQITLPALRELTRTRTKYRSRNPVIPHFKLHKKALRFRRSDVEAWLNQIAQSQTQSARAGAR
jgi:predicted DNA-binding transcriptional regulator AlpA